jgi:hypothetical protein
MNFRGAIFALRKDTLEAVPYLEALVTRQSENDPRDSKGRLLVDESGTKVYYIIDKYREWLEDQKPTHFSTSGLARGLYVSVARRLGCDPDFVDALKSTKIIDDEDTFKCLYCGNVYAKTEREAFRECRYHPRDCKCREPNSRFGCSRNPYHSAKRIKLSKNPRYVVNNEDYGNDNGNDIGNDVGNDDGNYGNDANWEEVEVHHMYNPQQEPINEFDRPLREFPMNFLE